MDESTKKDREMRQAKIVASAAFGLIFSIPICGIMMDIFNSNIFGVISFVIAFFFLFRFFYKNFNVADTGHHPSDDWSPGDMNDPRNPFAFTTPGSRFYVNRHSGHDCNQSNLNDSRNPLAHTTPGGLFYNNHHSSHNSHY